MTSVRQDKLILLININFEDKKSEIYIHGSVFVPSFLPECNTLCV